MAKLTKNLLIAEVSDLQRQLDYCQERKAYWLHEANRLALVVRRLGGDPNNNPEQKVKY